jgi:hypothetical protein
MNNEDNQDVIINQKIEKRKRKEIQITDSYSTFNQDMENLPESNNVEIQPTFLPRKVLRDPELATKQTIDTLQERTLQEDRKDYYGNPLGIVDSFESIRQNIKNNSFTWEAVRTFEDGFDNVKKQLGIVKPEDLYYQKDVDENEDLKALGLKIPESGWTSNQFKRMVEFSQDKAKQEELNRVKGTFGHIAEFGLNLAPFVNPYTAIAYMVASDAVLAPISLTAFIVGRFGRNAIQKVGIAGGVGGLGSAGLTGLLDFYTEKRTYEATGKKLTADEKISNMIFGGITGGLATGVFQGVSLKNPLIYEIIDFFRNPKTSSIARHQATNHLRENGIKNPEAILPEDKSTNADKFDTIQDLNKIKTQLQEGIDLDLGKVRNVETKSNFLKSNQNSSFNFFKTELNLNGKTYKTDFEIMEAANLTTSHDILGNVNKEYPSSYQPRDRSSQASREQVLKIANNPDPEQLIPSLSFSSGSPIIDKNGFVVIGNGRTGGLKEAYKLEKAGGYKQMLALEFPHLTPEKFDNPILVRKFRPETSEEDIIQLSRLSNKRKELDYNVVEQARLDAENIIRSNAIEYYQKGKFDNKKNNEFFKKFVSTLDIEERQNFFTPNGELSLAGEQRIEAGLVQYAYNNDNLTSFLYQNQDELSKTISNMLVDIAPDIIKIKNFINNGRLAPNLDISKDITGAFEIYAIHKRSKMELSDTLNNYNVFGNDIPPLQEAILRGFFQDEKNLTGILPKGKLNAIFDDLMSKLSNTNDTASSFEFASTKIEPLDVLQDIKKQLKPDYIPVKKPDYETMKPNNYEEVKNVSHEEVKKTLTEEEKSAYQKTLKEDAEIESWIKCNYYK